MRHACHSLVSLLVIGLLASPALARPTLSSKEFGGLKKEIQRAVKMSQYSDAAGKIGELGKDDSKRAIDFLCTIAKVPDAETYDAAMKAVAGMNSEEAREHVLKKLGKSGSPVAKMLLVDAMAERKDAFAGKALGEAVTDRAPEVQRAAISAIKRTKPTGAVRGLINLLKKLEKGDAESLNYALVQETLTKITGESFDKAEDWGKYWDTAEASHKPGRVVTGSAGRSPGGTARRKRPRFFGSELKSSRLVFVIDVSGSMQAADPPTDMTTGGAGGGRKGPQTGGGKAQPPAPTSNSRVRIERAKFQLIQAIKALPGKTLFTIMAYSGVSVVGDPRVDKIKPGGLLPPKMGQGQGFEWLQIWSPKLVGANEKSKKKAIEFVKKLVPNGATFSYNAIMHALTVPGADTIVLLSDGAPNDPKLKPEGGMQIGGQSHVALTPAEILKNVKAINRKKRVVIDTFGFDPAGGRGGGRGRNRFGGTGGGAGGAGGGGGGGFGGFMQDLATNNGGSYTQIK